MFWVELSFRFVIPGPCYVIYRLKPRKTVVLMKEYYSFCLFYLESISDRGFFCVLWSKLFVFFLPTEGRSAFLQRKAYPTFQLRLTLVAVVFPAENGNAFLQQKVFRTYRLRLTVSFE